MKRNCFFRAQLHHPKYCPFSLYLIDNFLPAIVILFCLPYIPIHHHLASPLISPTIAVSVFLFSFRVTLLTHLMSLVVGSRHKTHNHMNLRVTFLNVQLNSITQFSHTRNPMSNQFLVVLSNIASTIMVSASGAPIHLPVVIIISFGVEIYSFYKCSYVLQIIAISFQMIVPNYATFIHTLY